jgi:WD40 repeat protein
LLVEGPSSVVISSKKGEVDRWEVLDEQSAQPAPFDGKDTDVTVLDSTPAGNLLAAAGIDGRVVVWDLPSRRQRAVWPIGTEVTALRFDPTGRNLWAATDDGELRSFYVDGEHEEGSPLQARPVEGDQATGGWLDLSVTPTGVSGLRDDGTLVRWRARPESRLARPLRPPKASGEMLALASPTDGVVTGVAGDGTVRRWSEASPEAAESVVSQGSGAFLAAALTPDGDVAALLSDDGRVLVQQVGQAAPPSPAPAVEQAQAVAISRNGTRLAIGSRTGTVALVEVAKEGMRSADNRQLLTSGVTALAFSPDGDRLASADEAGAVRVTNLADSSADPLKLHGHTDGVYAMSFSNDGRLLATGGDDQKVILWDATSGRQLWTNLDHREKVRGFAFDDAASTLASVDEAGALLVSRLSDGRPIYPPLQHAEPLVAIAALSGKPSSFALAYDTAVDVWDLDERGWIQAACAVVGRDLTIREWADTSEQGHPPSICATATTGASLPSPGHSLTR